MQFKAGVKIDSVEIEAARVRPVIASRHAVWIQHRDEFEDVLPSQLNGSRIVLAKNEVQETVEYEAAGSLARMHAAADEINLRVRNKEYRYRICKLCAVSVKSASQKKPQVAFASAENLNF
jgi:hypothetical protein